MVSNCMWFVISFFPVSMLLITFPDVLKAKGFASQSYRVMNEYRRDHDANYDQRLDEAHASVSKEETNRW